jgi:nucleotide-binding universal stress UspA family protein
METIIIPTDFSPAADNALNYGVELAKYFNARMVLVHAYPLPTLNYEVGYSFEVLASIKDGILNKLTELKKEICQKNQASFDIECMAEVGSPFDIIREAVDKHNGDLVVMGIVGEAGKLKENLIGSTAVKAARELTIPVFIIPEQVKYHRIHKLAFACDLNKTEETNLVYVAKFFSKVFDAELEVVTVDIEEEEEVTLDKAVTNLFIEQNLEHVKHKTTHIMGNNIVFELEEYFKTCSTDAIMVNPKKHNWFYYLFHDSVTKKLAFHAGLPIIAIH